MSLYSRLHGRLPLKLTALQHPCRSCSPYASSGGDDTQCNNWNRNRRTDLVHQNSKSTQPQSSGDFAHGNYYTPARNQVNLLLLLLQEQGDIILASTLETRYTTARNTLRSLANWRSTSCAFPSTNHIYMSTRKERQAYSLLQTTMEPLSHGLWSCSSKPLTDRTGHYRAEGRFSSTGTTGDTPFIGTLPLPDKDSSQDDMPCRHPIH